MIIESLAKFGQFVSISFIKSEIRLLPCTVNLQEIIFFAFKRLLSFEDLFFQKFNLFSLL